jgi:O-antigen/teichoic acid export membrane protein
VASRERCPAGCTCQDPATCPALAEEHWHARQQAGLAVLMDIAAPVPFAMSEVSSAILPSSSAWLPRGDAGAHGRNIGSRAGPRDARITRGVFAGLLKRWRSDHLVRNSLYLMMSSGIQAALGFAFWIIMARLFSVGDVGRASSLMSATGLIAYFSLVGLNSALIQFLPTAKNSRALVTAALTTVAACAGAISIVYLLLTPVVAPQLAFVVHNPAFGLGFVILTVGASVNLISDSVFISARKAGLCALTDGVVAGFSKIIFGAVLAGTGAYGLFSAATGGMTAAALVSIVLMITALSWRPSFTNPLKTLKPLRKFSGANYIANALNLLPSVAVPVIILDRLGAEAAAYYFVAFQMATILYAAIYAVEQSFLAEGSQGETDWRAIRRRSRRLAAALFVPGGIVLALAAHWVLLAFGLKYSQNGTDSLEILSLTVIPLAAANWSWTVLRLSARLKALVFSNAVYSIGICATAWILAPHGLTDVTWAWPMGSTLAACVATAATTIFRRRDPARHRRTEQTRRVAVRAR